MYLILQRLLPLAESFLLFLFLLHRLSILLLILPRLLLLLITRLLLLLSGMFLVTFFLFNITFHNISNIFLNIDYAVTFRIHPALVILVFYLAKDFTVSKFTLLTLAAMELKIYQCSRY